MHKRLHVYYSGTVQGIGFRFTAENIAVNLELGGWVKNLADGRVEVLCEGEEADLVTFINKIKNGPMKHYISSQDIVWDETKDEFKNFRIRF
ncbi:MAG: acylphosphatase [Candidatus Omnitrophica bacterium]|nr:acylphosphatase [Candidatus Omnitrophota bacterium]MBU4488593.1 acylphosphatase [Candidatus Omnitrophota bacterium]MCG2704473.1 acylphosphatase [Candidatus Omnitrophota bacterium]